MKVVIDTNVIVSALRSSRGASNKLLSLLGSELFNFHFSVPIVLEYEYVLLKQANSLSQSKEEISKLIDSLCSLGTPHEIHFLWRPTLRDPQDEFILELAVTAQCDFIITYNIKDFDGIDKFGIQVISPKHFLQIIGEIP